MNGDEDHLKAARLILSVAGNKSGLAILTALSAGAGHGVTFPPHRHHSRLPRRPSLLPANTPLKSGSRLGAVGRLRQVEFSAIRGAISLSCSSATPLGASLRLCP